VKLTYYGHSCFALEEKGVTLLFDPFLSGNPKAPVKPDQVKANYILVSHAHGDHLGDTVDIAKRNHALVIATHEVANLVGGQGAESHGMHIGGKRSFDFGYVRIAPAFHGSGVEGGHACGFIVKFFGKVVYHAGDTGLFGDMKLLAELEKIDVALLPIGDNYTMGIGDAAVAARFLGAPLVVPMHYNTFPVIQANPLEFKNKVESEQKGTEVRVVSPGETTAI